MLPDVAALFRSMKAFNLLKYQGKITTNYNKNQTKIQAKTYENQGKMKAYGEFNGSKNPLRSWVSLQVEAEWEVRFWKKREVRSLIVWGKVILCYLGSFSMRF